MRPETKIGKEKKRENDRLNPHTTYRLHKFLSLLSQEHMIFVIWTTVVERERERKHWVRQPVLGEAKGDTGRVGSTWKVRVCTSRERPFPNKTLPTPFSLLHKIIHHSNAASLDRHTLSLYIPQQSPQTLFISPLCDET